MGSVDGLRVDAEDAFERWSFDQPRKRNAVHPAALRAIARRCGELRGEVVVLRGADDGPFCAGFDLDALQTALRSDPIDSAPDAVLAAATAAMANADATFIAATRGYVIGAGVELAAACDLRVGDEHGWMLVPAGKLGVVYHANGIARMHAAYGATATRTLLLTGDRVAMADPILRSAFARLEPAEGVTAWAEDLARRVAALDPESRRRHSTLLRALDAGVPSSELLAEHDRARTRAYADARERSSSTD
jgi:enoyl-CoA hydratase/carnithine racemase